MRHSGKALVFAFGFFVSVAANAMEYRPGEVIVKYKDGVTRTRTGMQMMYASLGVNSVKRLGTMMKGFEHLVFDPSLKVEDAIAQLEASGLVEYAEPNYIFELQPQKLVQDEFTTMADPLEGIGDLLPIICQIMPDLPFCKDSTKPGPGNRPAINPAPAEVSPAVADPDLAKTWGLAKTEATEAWKITKGSKDIVVAIIDSGVDYNHEDLAFNMWRNKNVDPAMKDEVGYNFFHKDGLPYDDLYVKIPANPEKGTPEREIYGHGTHCAGTIGAVGGNGIGTAGINQRVSLMAVKFMDGEGKGDLAASVSAIDYAVQKGAKVLSNSWGASLSRSMEGFVPQLKSIKEAIQRAEQKGVLFVAAAGNGDQQGIGMDNDGSTTSYPASFVVDNIVSVAASDQNDAITKFSNYGKTTVHLAAPGFKIYSSVPGPKAKYAEYMGTSMATPHVAGAAALIWSKNPTWSYKEVKKALLDNVDKVSDPRIAQQTITGGRLNVLKALQ